MFERFHHDARQAVILAQENARRLHHDFIGTEHILLGLLAQPDALSARVLGRHGLDHDRARQSVLRLLPQKPEDTLDADALESIGIDLSAIREKVEAADRRRTRLIPARTSTPPARSFHVPPRPRAVSPGRGTARATVTWRP
jgi:ATP-dependent Clp protease ATP-binding subunit ClpA